MSEQSIVDVAFPIRGRRVPDDHGYALYAALCHLIPGLHGAAWLGVHPIRGPQRVDGGIRLERSSRLRLRVPAARIGDLVSLVGQRLSVGDDEIWLGAPTVEPLVAAPSLDAKIVVVKVTRPTRSEAGHLDKSALEQRVRLELERQLEKVGARAKVATMGRRQIVVGGRRVLGFSVRLTELDEPGALAVMQAGLGGKRRMGCGVFTPTVGR